MGAEPCGCEESQELEQLAAVQAGALEQARGAIKTLRRKLRATRGEFDECAIEGCPGQALPSDDCCLRCWAEETDPELFARREAERETERIRRHQRHLSALGFRPDQAIERLFWAIGRFVEKAKETSE